MATTKQLRMLDKGIIRKGCEAYEAQEMCKEKLVFKSGEIIQSLSEIQAINEIDPKTGDKKYKFSWEKMATKDMRSLAPLAIGGLGYSEAKMADIFPLEDSGRLTEKLSEFFLQKHLDELISVQLIVDMHDGTTPKVKILYFLRNGKVFMLSEQELALKHWKELETCSLYA